MVFKGISFLCLFVPHFPVGLIFTDLLSAGKSGKVLRASFPLSYGHFKPITNHYLKIDRIDILVSRLSGRTVPLLVKLTIN